MAMLEDGWFDQPNWADLLRLCNVVAHTSAFIARRNSLSPIAPPATASAELIALLDALLVRDESRRMASAEALRVLEADAREATAHLREDEGG